MVAYMSTDIAVMYIEPDGDRVLNVFQKPKLNIRTNYGHDWVEGGFESGHTMWITVTNSVGTPKATAFGARKGPVTVGERSTFFALRRISLDFFLVNPISPRNSV
jgi:hypothetical protein